MDEEALARRKSFEQHRKLHYNEFLAVKLAKIAREEEDEEEQEQEQEEVASEVDAEKVKGQHTPSMSNDADSRSSAGKSIQGSVV